MLQKLTSSFLSKQLRPLKTEGGDGARRASPQAPAPPDDPPDSSLRQCFLRKNDGARVLKISDLKAGYGAIQILHGVNLKVERGSIVAVLGGNGTGKSTLLKVISGLLKPTDGLIEFEGEPIQRLPPDKIVRRGLVQITQGKEVYPAMTVDENLRIGGFICTDAKRTRRTLERVYSYFPDLAARRKDYSALLSGGQRQMLVIGRGLMTEPKMLLLDEPSAALAPLAVLEIFRTISRINRDGLTVLIVEQNVRMALLLAEYAYVIQEGVVGLEDEAAKLIGDERVRMAYLGGTVAGAVPL
jgi:branched-chain amino acid transport system ATP-binding protein